MTKNLSDHDVYMCEECGNTSPIADEVCSACGGKMSSLNGEDNHNNDELHDDNGNPDESLDALREQEDKESEDEYHGSFQDTDNIE
jgi:predicted ATP-dependent serine protease